MLTLPTRGDEMYVISGLNEGDRVVVGGIAEAVEGREVIIISSEKEQLEGSAVLGME